MQYPSIGRHAATAVSAPGSSAQSKVATNESLFYMAAKPSVAASAIDFPMLSNKKVNTKELFGEQIKSNNSWGSLVK
ncbi:MAG: hypothetical protein KUG82_23050 [Pseudomonadales bacterium]|nr:hypothetical protein [Pseudomonadales bacterium]